jgi:hypothetical protein
MSAEALVGDRIPKDAAAISDQALVLADETRGFQVTTRLEFTIAAEKLRTVKGFLRDLEAQRTKVTGPMNEALRQVNEWFRGPRDNLERAERTLKNALASFEAAETAKIRAQERAAAEAARRDQEELARRAASAEAKGQAAKAEELKARAAAVVPATPALAPVKAKAMAFTDVWDIQVVDAALVPREYLMVDEAKIKAVVKATKGTVPIPGVQITHRRDVRSGS